MTAPIKSFDDPSKPVGEAKRDTDREALRAEINKRYEHTLRRLGK